MRGHFLYVPLDRAQEPAEGHAYVNRWWTVHPEKGVVFYLSSLRLTIEGEINTPAPQCNGCEEIARRLTAQLRPDCEVRFLPAVYAAHARREQVRMKREADAARAA